MEKSLDFSNRSYLHTLEPRLFYLYIPNINQQNIPIFDTALNDFSFNSMFLENALAVQIEYRMLIRLQQL